jgi:thioredoxin reductase
VKGKKIAIVGAGDAAFDYAMTLSSHNSVHIHNRGTRVRCLPALLEIARKQENIIYFENSVPSDSYDYTIFATGREPDLDCMSDDLKKMQSGLEQQGVLYVIGDVNNGEVRQTSVATGDGVKAAMAIVEITGADEGNQQDKGT